MARFILGILGCLLFARAAHAGFGMDPYEVHSVYGWARSVAIGDINGDQRNDVVVAQSPTGAAGVGDFKLFIFYQTAEGALADPVIYPLLTAQNHALALADLDRDGRMDIVIGHNAGITVFRTRYKRSGGLERRNFPVGQGNTGVAIVDVDGDGKLDVVGQGDGSPPMVYLGDGSGGIRATQSLPAGAAGYGLKVGDVNHDGLPDLVFNTVTGPIGVVYHDKHAGYLATTAIYDPGYPAGELALGDFDRDGLLDIATSKTGWSDAIVSIFSQNASGAPFTTAHPMTTAAAPDSSFASDLDGNGRDDLLVTHDLSHQLGVYLQGAGGLAPELLLPTTGGGTINIDAIDVGDVNGDGCKDVVIGDYSAGVLVFHSHECIVPPDLSIALAGGKTSITAGLANSAGTESINEPLIRFDLSVGAGAVQTGPLPAGCAVQASTARSQRIECLVETLGPGATAALTIPVGCTGRGAHGTLTVRVRAMTDTAEKTLKNNVASLRVRP